MNVVSKTIMTAFLMLIPALSQAETSVSCAVHTGVMKYNSIGVNLNANASSDFVTLSGNKLGQGVFTSSRVELREEQGAQFQVISLANDKGDKMEVYSQDYQQFKAGMYTGEATIKAGVVETNASEITYCTIIVK